MRKWFDVKKKKRASIIAKQRAHQRWAKVREEARKHDTAPPVVPWTICERIVRIVNESDVLEATIYEHDLPRDRKRKLRAIGLI